jgi:Na+/H+ antiporter NhaD/arsenite permease-like protein
MEPQAIIAAATFVLVIVAVTFELVHMTVAALLGALVLIFTHILTLPQAMEYIAKSHATLALFLGVMILVRSFEPTKIFEFLATKMVILSRGSGKLLLLGIAAVVTPICAVLPNATTIMLLAPLIPPIAQEIGVDFVPILILMVLLANSAGLLTIIGDPATFIVGDAIGMNFFDYLQKLSLGGVFAVVAIVAVLPFLLPDIWNAKFENVDRLPDVKIDHPRVLTLGLIIAAIVLVLFAVGEMIHESLTPAAVALLGATLALFLAHQSKIDTVDRILSDVNWSVLIFFMCIFVLIGGLQKTGVVGALSQVLAAILGKNIILGSLALVIVIGLISSIIPNIPLVVAMVPLLKGYLIDVGFVTQAATNDNFNWQAHPQVLPLFYAMMFGATLGGNGTIFGASSNIVAAGISAQHGKNISFKQFLKYGFPVMVLQLVVSCIYLLIFHLR